MVKYCIAVFINIKEIPTVLTDVITSDTSVCLFYEISILCSIGQKDFWSGFPLLYRMQILPIVYKQ